MFLLAKNAGMRPVRAKTLDDTVPVCPCSGATLVTRTAGCFSPRGDYEVNSLTEQYLDK